MTTHLESPFSEFSYRFLTDSKMYHFVCFILFVSVNGQKPSDTIPSSFSSASNPTVSTNASVQTFQTNPMTRDKPTATPTVPATVSKTEQTPGQSSMGTGCLINLKDKKEMTLWLMIVVLSLICFLLLIIIMCLTCKCCRGTKNNELVVTKSPQITRSNSENGGPSETDIMLKDCSSVKVEIEATEDESQVPEEVGGATAKVGNQVSTEENKNSADVTSETTPTQEVDQSDETGDLKMEDLEKAE